MSRERRHQGEDVLYKLLLVGLAQRLADPLDLDAVAVEVGLEGEPVLVFDHHPVDLVIVDELAEP